ncbi:MAG TPA: DNA-binding protein [Nitrososphaeraceae archaeon]|nr:double-stranded DNA-binding protein [Thermoproteota archaeon]HZA64086.1 DNA-binding protein [Nitrososphaeraceae archaeon]
MSQEDPDIAIIKARKMKELRDKAAAFEKAKKREQQPTPQKENDREIISTYLYDRGEEVLKLAESQYPYQTKAILARIIELIKAGEISQRISGGELLALFRSIGLKIRVNTSIKIEDHGKLVSLSDKLKQQNEDMTDDTS